jgi:hypothetical protein
MVAKNMFYEEVANIVNGDLTDSPQVNWLGDACIHSMSYLRSVFGSHATYFTKSLVVGGGLIGVTWLACNSYKYLSASASIATYAPAEKNLIKRAFQRAVVDHTKQDVSIDWFPTNFLPSIRNRLDDNGHAKCGAARDTARVAIDLAVKALGKNIFEISPASQSKAKPDTGVHLHYAPGDLARDLVVKTPGKNDVVVGIDVDYYVENWGFLLQNPVPVVLYSFNPETVAGIDGDAPFRIQNNEVLFEVGGGGRWKHRVWDWCGHGEFISITVPCPFYLRLFGVENVLHYKVHHARPWSAAPHRTIVWLLPQYRYRRVKWIADDMNDRTLGRVEYRDPLRPGWNRIVKQDDKNEMIINFGREGHDATVTIKKEHFDTVVALDSQMAVSSRLLSLGYANNAMITSLTSQYIGKKLAGPEECYRLGKPARPKVHWPAASEIEEPVTNARVYSSPVVSDENLMPMIRRYECVSNSIDKRVTFVKNDKIPSTQYYKLASEFISLVVPESGVGVPYPIEITAEMLNKPSQVLAVKQIMSTVDVTVRNLIECFPKNEPTMKNTRIISSFADARFLLRFSQYTLAFRNQVLHAEHNSHWFCPGGTPAQIADKVVEYVRNIAEPLEGDFSNFDGTVSRWCQERVMNAVYHRFFGPEYAKELSSYTRMLVDCPARSKTFGFRYDAGVGVKSGSPTTCDLNTVLNAFMQYCAVRLTYTEIPIDQAFRMIGLAFGDDSLFEQTYAKKFARVAVDLGMELKLEKYDPSLGVTFLARVYVDPYTTTTTMQDPLRTLRKLHMTARDPNIPIADAAVDRVTGYLVTDKYTPLISEYCEMIKRIYSHSCSTVEVREARKSSTKEKPYWLTQGGAWPQREEDQLLMVEILANRTQIPIAEIVTMIAMFERAEDPWFRPIDRNLDKLATADTLLNDGLVTEMDQRKYDDVRSKTNQRAPYNSNRTSSMPSENNNRPFGKGNGGKPRHEQKFGVGPKSFQERNGSDGAKTGSNRKGSSGQANVPTPPRPDTPGPSKMTNRHNKHRGKGNIVRGNAAGGMGPTEKLRESGCSIVEPESPKFAKHRNNGSGDQKLHRESKYRGKFPIRGGSTSDGISHDRTRRSNGNYDANNEGRKPTRNGRRGFDEGCSASTGKPVDGKLNNDATNKTTASNV